MADSVVANNGNGFYVVGSSAVTAFMIVRTLIANNLFGIQALEANATVRVSQSTITGNGTSWTPTISLAGLASLRSYGDNTVDGNGDGNPAPPTIGKK